MRKPGVKLLLDGNRGEYLPQAFARMFNPSKMRGLNPEDIAIINSGPTRDETYWEAWDNIIKKVTFEEEGNTYRLHHDQDLFAICDELMTPTERRAFGLEG